MIKIEPCPGCGRNLLRHRVANLDVRIEPAPLDGPAAVAEIVGGRSLWMVDAQQVRPARPGEPGPLREHRCPVKAVDAPLTASQPSKAPTVPANPPVRPQAGSRPSSGRQTASSTPASARTVLTPVSDTADCQAEQSTARLCSTCRQPIRLDATDTYAMIELGSTLVDIFHAGPCPEGR